MDFIDLLSDAVFTLYENKGLKEKKQYVYFDALEALRAFKKYGIIYELDLQALKDNGRRNIELLAMKLCCFSLVDDVYIRTDKMKELIKEIIPDIMNVELCWHKITRCVSKWIGKSVITDDVFYYGAIFHTVTKYLRSKNVQDIAEELEALGKLVAAEDSLPKLNEHYLKGFVDGLEDRIESPPFDLNLKDIVCNTEDKHSMIHKLLKEVYIVNSPKRKIKDCYTEEIFNKKFTIEYKNLLDQQIEHILGNQEIRKCFYKHERKQ